MLQKLITTLAVEKAKSDELGKAFESIDDFLGWTNRNEMRDRLTEVFGSYIKDMKKHNMLDEKCISDAMFDLKLLHGLVDAVFTVPIVVEYDDGVKLKEETTA